MSAPLTPGVAYTRLGGDRHLPIGTVSTRDGEIVIELDALPAHGTVVLLSPARSESSTLDRCSFCLQQPSHFDRVEMIVGPRAWICDGEIVIELDARGGVAVTASLDLPTSALALAADLDRRGALLDGRAAQAIRELVAQNAQLVAAMADAARAVAGSTTEHCAEVADRAAREYAENARMAPPGTTDALARSLTAERIAREIRATGKVRL